MIWRGLLIVLLVRGLAGMRAVVQPWAGGGAPFGRIRHRAGSEKCADGGFWEGYIAGMGWNRGKVKGRAVLGVRSDTAYVGYRCEIRFEVLKNI